MLWLQTGHLRVFLNCSLCCHVAKLSWLGKNTYALDKEILKTISKYYSANKVQIKDHWDSRKIFTLAYICKT